MSLISMIAVYTSLASLLRLNLRNADLQRRNFAGMTSLCWANLTDALLSQTDLRGSNLKNAKGMTLNQVDVAQIDELTVLPDYLTRQLAVRKSQTETSQPNTEPIVLPADILFGTEEYKIQPAAIAGLQNLAQLIQRSGNGVVQLNGYTDSVGSKSYNQELSERRATAVKEWLVTNGGIPSHRLEAKGFGSANPRVSEIKADGSDDPNARQQNRRVEVRIPPQ